MELSITEKFLLLAQHPEKGKFIISGIHIQYGIVGALLLEMSLENRIDLQNIILTLKTTKSHHNLTIAEIENQIRSVSKPKKINRWMNKLSRKSKKFKKTILDQLVRKHIIRIEQRSFLGIIPYQKHYLINRKLRSQQIQHLKTAILSNKTITSDDIVMMGLIEACKMQSILTSDKSELKIIKQKLKEIIKDSRLLNLSAPLLSRFRRLFLLLLLLLPQQLLVLLIEKNI